MTGMFGGTPLVMGSVRGLRVFKLRTRYREPYVISPLWRAQYWDSGENVSKCAIYNPQVEVGVRSQHWRNRVHRTGNGFSGCSCGFYAYYRDVRQRMATEFPLSGVIEGYGLVTLGTHGFRAQKCRIVALALGYGRFERHPETVHSLEEKFKVPVFKDWRSMTQEIPLTRRSDLAELEKT